MKRCVLVLFLLVSSSLQANEVSRDRSLIGEALAKANWLESDDELSVSSTDTPISQIYNSFIEPWWPRVLTPFNESMRSYSATFPLYEDQVSCIVYVLRSLIMPTSKYRVYFNSCHYSARSIDGELPELNTLHKSP